MLMKKILILLDVGHGLYTYGKRMYGPLDPNETREWVLNDRIADALELRAAEYDGLEIIRLDDPSGKRDVPLSERTAKANKLMLEYEAKGYTVIVISLHHNAGLYGRRGGGITSYIDSRRSSETSKMIRDAVYDELIATTAMVGNRNDPKTDQPLYILYNTKMPGTLVEHGFMDSPTDVPKILSPEHPVQCAEAYINFLVKTYGVQKKAVAPPPKPVDDLSEYAYTTQNLNVRAGRSTSHRILTALPRGTKVRKLYLANGWWSIDVPLSVSPKGYGFVSAAYLANRAPDQPKYREGKVNATRGLNVRKGPGVNYGIVTTFKHGTVVTIYEEKSGWYRIGAGRWVSGKYII
ncbi:SH3 domain-containing protein [Proteiniclasticum sp. BAD-10]|uniref:SH3 domain-containing protein n=1 Tax=Proteiniclasticum sediminis TaxID=2804028 RepID=A0A941CS33_9CLOT|nr:SH3 domain-containing protein [Proteiniclasticum sediminis]MBR0576743.1 SH3 domain-containing protein [Proteiniclasticum sediminis]